MTPSALRFKGLLIPNRRHQPNSGGFETIAPRTYHSSPAVPQPAPAHRTGIRGGYKATWSRPQRGKSPESRDPGRTDFLLSTLDSGGEDLQIGSEAIGDLDARLEIGVTDHHHPVPDQLLLPVPPRRSDGIEFKRRHVLTELSQ